MNVLSWFLYVADALQNMSFVLGIMFFLSICCLILGIIFSLIHTAGEYGGASRIEFFAEQNRRGAVLLRYSVPAGIVFAIAFTIIPSKSTMYAIAASEMGERLAANEAVQGIASDATKALQQWIKRQIEPEKK